MSDLFYVDIDQGIRKGKCNVAQSEKLSGFSYTTFWIISYVHSRKPHIFLKSAYLDNFLN